MRGRDVREKLEGRVDPVVLDVLCTLAEINHGNVLHLASLAQMVDKMTDIIQSFTEVAANMKERTDQMARALGDEVEGEPTDAVRPSIESVKIELTTDFDLPAYDNTRLVAINTCPTWGIVRYGLNKEWLACITGGARNMALECGSAAHDFFAAVRLWQLRNYQERPDLSDSTWPQIFGATRYEQMLKAWTEVKILVYSRYNSVFRIGKYWILRRSQRQTTNLHELRGGVHCIS